MDAKKNLYVFGQFDNLLSSGSVSKGLLEGLVNLKDCFDLYFVNTRYSATNWGTFDFKLDNTYIFHGGGGGERLTEWKPGADFPDKIDIALFYGYPPVGAGLLDFLSTKGIRVGSFVGYLIAESMAIPYDWVKSLYKYDRIFVPSAFVETAFKNSALCRDLVDPLPPIEIAWHGIDLVYIEAAKTRDYVPNTYEDLRLLHITGARDFPHRKGTVDLLRVLTSFFEKPLETLQRKRLDKMTLKIRIAELSSDHIVKVLAEALNDVAGRDFVSFDFSEDPLTPEEMLAYYRENGGTLIQPSRVEAFGLCVLEAYMAGLPVYYTDVTGSKGFRTHARLNTTWRRHDWGHIKVQGIPNGFAPLIDEDLRRFFHDYLMCMGLTHLNSNRRITDNFDVFSWQETLAPMRTVLRQLEKNDG